jgi:sugar lactone lactonase YvrE
MSNPLKGFRVTEADIEFPVRGVRRPECILAQRSGVLWCSDPQGVRRIDPDGTQTVLGDLAYTGFEDAPDEATRYGAGSLPTGFALMPNGDIIIANFGLNRFEKIAPDGTVSVFLDQIDGRPLGKANFVYLDLQGRLWLTVSIRHPNWVEAVKLGKIDDGMIILVDENGPRVVADNVIFTNEVRLDAAGEHLYVVETFAHRIVRFRVGADGSLSNREVFGPERLPIHPDGIAFDQAGNLWIAAPIDEQVVALTPDGELLPILDFGQPDKIAAYNAAGARGDFSFDYVWAAGWKPNPLLTGLAFGGPDLQTVYLGSLGGAALPAFRSPVPGVAMAHWELA